jgi:hypothetical protein
LRHSLASHATPHLNLTPATLPQFTTCIIIRSYIEQVLVNSCFQDSSNPIRLAICLKDVACRYSFQFHFPGVLRKDFVRYALAIETSEKLMTLVCPASEPALRQFDFLTPTIRTDSPLCTTHRLQHPSPVPLIRTSSVAEKMPKRIQSKR